MVGNYRIFAGVQKWRGNGCAISGMAGWKGGGVGGGGAGWKGGGERGRGPLCMKKKVWWSSNGGVTPNRAMKLPA